MNVPNFTEIDITQIRLDPPQAPKSSGNATAMARQSNIKSDQFPHLNGRIIFRIPSAKTAHPLSQAPYKNPDGTLQNPNKYTLQLAFEGSENGYESMTPQAKQLHKFIMDLDAHIEKIIQENAGKWNIKRKNYLKTIKDHVSNEGTKYPDTMAVRAKFNGNDETFLSRFYDAERGNELIHLTRENVAREIPRNTKGVFDVQLTRVWFSNMGCGSMMDLEQASIKRPLGIGNLPPPPVFEDDEVDEQTQQDQVQQKLAQLSTSAPPVMAVEDEEIEPEEDDEMSAPPSSKGKAKANGAGRPKATTTKTK